MLTVVILFRQCKTTCEQTKIRTPVWWHCLPCSWGEVKNSATDGSQNSPQPPFTQFIYHVHMYTVQYSGLYTFYNGWLTGVHYSTLHTAGKLRISLQFSSPRWWERDCGGGGGVEEEDRQRSTCHFLAAVTRRTTTSQQGWAVTQVAYVLCNVRRDA